MKEFLLKPVYKKIRMWHLMALVALIIIGALNPSKNSSSSSSEKCCCIYIDRDDNIVGYKGTGMKMKVLADPYTCTSLMSGTPDYGSTDCGQTAVLAD